MCWCSAAPGPTCLAASRTPFFPITPILGVIFCVIVMLGLAGVTWLAFALWMLVGLVAYFLYGYRHSRLNRSLR